MELNAIFQDAAVLDPQVTLAVPYQWQKRSSAGEWVDLLGATNNTLTFSGLQPNDVGSYRLRATYHCEPFYSRTAVISLIAPVISSALGSNGKLTLHVAFPVASRAKVQSSTDLTTWVDHAEIPSPLTEWTAELPAEDDLKFYRVQELP